MTRTLDHKALTRSVILALLLLTGCDCITDKTKEERVFLECVKAAKNANDTTYNDSAEVVQECRMSASKIANSCM